MRLGLEPVAQPYPYSAAAATSAANVFPQPTAATNPLLNQNGGAAGATMQMSSTSSDEDAGAGDSSFEKTSSTNAVEADTELRNDTDEVDRPERVSTAGGGTAGGDSAANNAVTVGETDMAVVTGGTNVTSSSPNNNGIYYS